MAQRTCRPRRERAPKASKRHRGPWDCGGKSPSDGCGRHQPNLAKSGPPSEGRTPRTPRLSRYVRRSTEKPGDAGGGTRRVPLGASSGRRRNEEGSSVRGDEKGGRSCASESIALRCPNRRRAGNRHVHHRRDAEAGAEAARRLACRTQARIRGIRIVPAEPKTAPAYPWGIRKLSRPCAGTTVGFAFGGVAMAPGYRWRSRVWTSRWTRSVGSVRGRFPARILSRKQVLAVSRDPNSLPKVIDDSPQADWADWNSRREELEARKIRVFEERGRRERRRILDDRLKKTKAAEWRAPCRNPGARDGVCRVMEGGRQAFHVRCKRLPNPSNHA